MTSKKFRTIETIGSDNYIFSTEAFKNECNKFYIKKRAEKKNYKKKELWDSLARLSFVSESAIFQWHSGKCGPSSISIVKAIADYLGINYCSLLTKEAPNEDDNMINNNQIFNYKDNYTEQELIKSVYQEILTYDENYDEDASRKSYYGFFNDVTRLIFISSLDISNSTRQKLYNIILEYTKHLEFSGCARWEYISRDTNTYCWVAKILFRDKSWFDEEEQEERLNTLIQDIRSRLEALYTIKIKRESCHYYPNNGIINYDEALEFAKSHITDDINKLDEMSMEIDEYELDDTMECNNITPEIAYRWYFSDMLTKVFRHDFPQYFNDKENN